MSRKSEKLLERFLKESKASMVQTDRVKLHRILMEDWQRTSTEKDKDKNNGTEKREEKLENQEKENELDKKKEDSKD